VHPAIPVLSLFLPPQDPYEKSVRVRAAETEYSMLSRSFSTGCAGLALLSSSLLVFPLAVAAEDSTDFTLNPIVVTTTLATETADDTLSSVTVIDAKALDRQQPREFGKVLQGQPGISVVSSGGFGKNTSVFTRGTGSESTVLLIDGIRIRSATTGGAPWQHIPPQLLNRVEIVRGPRGSLYGADAVGGVVQGFTLSETGGDGAWVEAGGGTFSARQTGAGVTGQAGATRYSVQGNYFETDGTRVREGGDNKGYRNASGSASLRHEFDSGASVGLLGFRSQGNTEFDTGETDFILQTLGVNAETPVSDNWRTGITLSESRDEGDTDDGASVFNTKTHLARWQNTVTVGRQQVIAGAEYLVDEVDSTTDYDEDSRDNKALFGQVLVNRGAADLQVSLRWDDNEAYGDRTTGATAVGIDLDPSHRVRLSYGTAFRAPSFNDLYFPNFGNPDLRPERSYTSEIGFRGQYTHGFWDLAIFQTTVDDLIVLAENVDRSRLQGVELSAGTRLGGLELGSQLTLQDPRNQQTNDRLQRRTKKSLRLDADYYSRGRVNFGATVIAEGDRYNDGDNEERISGFVTADLRVGVQLAENLSLRFTMENMFDHEYNTVRATPFGADDFDFLAPGRTVFASLRYGAR